MIKQIFERILMKMDSATKRESIKTKRNLIVTGHNLQLRIRVAFVKGNN